MKTSPPAAVEIIARGVLVHAGRVLLCRNVRHDYRYLPGGHVEPDEPAQAALAREFMEETGERVRPGRLLLVAEARFVQKAARRHELNLVFHVEHDGPTAGATPPPFRSREPKIDFEWVAADRLADVDLRPHAIRDWLAQRLAAGAGSPGAAWLTIDG